MQTKLNKILSFLTVVILIAVTAMPSIAYATDEIETAKTSEENVKFNVSINGGTDATINVSDKSKIDVSLNVLNTGYIKEATLTVDNNNYKIDNIDSQYVNKIENNVITLNQVNAGENAQIELPIEFEKKDKINLNLFNQKSKITLNAVYVNETGKEKKIQKEYELNIKWTKDDAQATISQRLVRYLTYDQNKTMLSFEVTSGIKDNTIPASSEIINIKAPQINGTLPQSVIVTGDSNEHQYKDGIVAISSQNNADENGEVNWNSTKTYMVTYIYETTPVLGTLTQNAMAKITTMEGKELTAEPENKDFAAESEVGSIVEFKEEGTDSLSKGYLISNLDRPENKLETSYSENYVINVGLSSSIDKINVNESDSQFVDSNGKTILSATDKIANKKISINKDELVSILGDEGRITVVGADGKEIGKLTKDTTELDLANNNTISLETSKPQTEGNITLKVEKAIVGNLGLDKATINSIATLKSKVTITGTVSNTVISSKDIEKDIKLTSPTSKVGISLSKDTLSTVEENKNVVISIILKTNSIDDALFENPTLHIKLPDVVKTTQVTNAQVLYDDELTAGKISGTGNTIDLTINGKQTKYASSTVSEGTLIILNTNLTLDNTAASDTKSISVSYTNAGTGETGESSHNVKIVAPGDFVTTNTVTVEGQTETSANNEDKTIKVSENAKEQTVKVSQTIVNNLGTDANGVTVLGVLPAAGNKTVDGQDLQSTTDAKLTSAVTVEGQDDAKVYYSTNNNESVDSNNWTENYTEDAKSYKVTTASTVPAKKALKINYAAKLASNLGYDQSTSETYGVYYNNESDDGVKTNLVSAKKVVMKTASTPKVTMTISASDTNEGYAISENGTVKTGEYVTYNVKVTNSGSETIQNATVKMSLPTEDTIVTGEDGKATTEKALTDLAFIAKGKPGQNSAFFDYYALDSTEKTLTIDSLGAGETKTLSFGTYVIRKYQDQGTDDKNSTDNTTQNVNSINPNFALNYTNGIEQKKTFSNKLEDGTLTVKLASNLDGIHLKQEDRIEFEAIIQNSSSTKEQKNVEYKVKVPDGLDYVTTDFTDDEKELYDTDRLSQAITYDKSTRTITCKCNDLSAGASDVMIFTLKVSSNQTKEIKFNGTVTSDIEKNGIKSNSVSILTSKSGTTMQDSGIEIKQSTNVPNNTCYDTDSFNIYIDINNNSGIAKKLNIENMLPEGLYVNNYTISIGNKKINEAKSDFIYELIQLNNGESARITVNVKPNVIQKGKTQTFEIKTSALILNDNSKINSDVLKININGTGDATADAIQDEDETQSDGTYIIGGKIFNDSNNNGKKDDGEAPISNVKVRLIDAQTKQTAKNADGNNCETTTGGDGTYSFTRLNKNNYVVIAEYDTSKYTVGIYQASDVSEDENNDFISQTFDGQSVAASNIINPTKNEYNIDLALVNMDTFDLNLNKIVSKITVVNSKRGKKVYNYNKNNAKVELSARDLNLNNVLIEYKIQIKNEGNIPGYASSIVDKIPEGLTFNSELNETWYVKDNKAYNQTLANTLINPGETKEVTLVLTKQITNDNLGSFNNVAEIEKSYNDYSIADIDSTAGNMQDGEDDQSSALTTILIGTGRTIMKVSIITVIILGGIGLAVLVLKKKVAKDIK